MLNRNSCPKSQLSQIRIYFQISVQDIVFCHQEETVSVK